MTVSTGSREATAFTKFRLLMWKNFLQQWRRRIQTVVELLLPAITMSLVLLLRGQLSLEPREIAIYEPIMAHSLSFSNPLLYMMTFNQNNTELSLAYSPASPELEDVVRSAFAKMLLRNVDELYYIIQQILDLPDLEIPPDLDTSAIYGVLKRLVRIREFNSSLEMRGLYSEEEETMKVIAAVEFDDLLFGATELPRNITYALRFPERPRTSSFFGGASMYGRSWRTNLVFPIFERPGPRIPLASNGGTDPGYITEMFIALQNSVSSEIVSRLTGQNLTDTNITVQRYPHPPYLHDVASELLEYLFPVFIGFAFSYTAINIVRAVTMEKELQLKEIMKIMGLPTWLHWTAWFCKQFIYLIAASILIVILMKVQWFSTELGVSYAVFTSTPWTVLLFFMIIYMMCMICFCFMLSGLFSSASTAALFTGVIWFLSGVPAALVTMEIEVSVGLQTFSCLSINTAMSYGFQLLMAQEGTGGVQWGEFFSSPSTESTRFTFGHVVIMLLVDAALYMLIALYLEQVLPGPFGTPKRWNFLFTKDFWVTNKSRVNGENIYDVDIDPDDSNILKEPDPIGLAVGVNINNLSKAYGSNLAVNCLSMNIYDDQITVLLGHNGAGKSTTISVLTGNVAPTSGSVVVAGYDLARQPVAARSNIGLCAQHNVLFNELTVKEHLEFFARLKGFEGLELIDEIDSLILKLGLQDKRDYLSQGLSGGQKRRLCVGIALCGKAKVVLLDEPTSGMDPASRRDLWDLLQKEKKDRSMILTTHFMDEADFLGDRIAIMAQGRLQCVGSPQFLKRTHGLSYQLVVVKDTDFDQHKCSDLIKKYIPDFITKDERGTEVTFSLSNDYAYLFETMLEDLENNVATIKFKNYGLISTTLEDVFMSLGADVSLLDSNSEDGNTTTASDAGSMDHLHDNEVNKEVTGYRLIVQHFRAVWLKLWLYWSRSWGIVLLQLTVPVLLINMTLLVSRMTMNVSDSVVPRHLSLTEGFTRTESLVSYNGVSTDTIFARAKPAYESMFASAGIATMQTTAVEHQALDEYYLERSQAFPRAMSVLRHSVLIGATFSEDAATAWFSNFGYHDVAVSLAAVHNALLKAVDSTANLQVFNYPLQANYGENSNMQTQALVMSLQLSNGIGTSVGIISAIFILFYIKERASGAKLLQKAAGLQPARAWLSAALFDWLWFVFSCLTVLASCAAFSVPGLSTPAELGRLYICIMIYGAAMLPMIYLFTLLFRRPAIGFVVVFFMNALLGMMCSQIVAALKTPGLSTNETAVALDMAFQFYPMYSFVTSVRKLNELELLTESCLQMCDNVLSMPGVTECDLQTICELNVNCCITESSTFDWDDPGILRYLVVMLASCAVFWALLMVIEYRLLRRLFTWKKNPPPQSSLDADVAAEELHVSRIDRASLNQHGLVAKGLSKYYGKHLAVDQISFSVNDSECFGLLGINGAGKTTTFKMLMGDETISSGEAFVNGYSVEKQSTKVYENIGYCPQFDALFPELTGRETLRLFSLLRGQSPEVIDLQAAALADSLGFLPHLDKRFSEYSGGTRRKLNTAVAFLGNTRLVFVDEPTTGVDPAAKRHVWRAVRSVQKSGRGVVLTSHSMEECEALCSRLTVMVNGRFQCLGTPQHLKNKFSQGYILTVKVKIAYAQTEYTQATDGVKHFVSSNFMDAKLMEEHQGVLTFYLPDLNMPWSKMFGTMERAKRELAIEYYSITQTTLEQIFLQFAQYQTYNK